MSDLENALILTGRDFGVVACNDKASLLSHIGPIEKDDFLFDHFPALKSHGLPENLEHDMVLSGIPIKDLTAEVRVIPAGEFVSFTISGNSSEKSSKNTAAELELLREQNKHLLAVIEEAPIGILLVDEKGEITYLNKKQEENSRKKREKLIGKHIKEAYPKAHKNPQVAEMYNNLLNNKADRLSVLVDHYYPQFYRRDMIIKFLACKIPDLNWTALFIEVEDDLYREKRKAEKAGEELRQSQTFLAQVLDASPNMVMSVDSKNRIVSFNKTAEHMLGFSASQVFNTPVERFFPREELSVLDEAISSKSLWLGTVNIYRFDKTTVQIELYVSKVRDVSSGKEIATLLLGVDIEEREKLRKNLIQLQKMTFIGEIVSAIAHQINNPLVGVINIADVLMQKMDREDERYRLTKMIHDAGISCHETISRLLSFSRKPQKNKRVIVDIRDVLGASIDFVSRHGLFEKVDLIRSFHAVPLICADPDLLQQAFMNMLYNSAQAVDEAGRIEITCSGDYGMGRQVEVSITDNGEGIPLEDIPKIFEPFYTTKEESKGTGIGLSLVYWIIQDHNGRIEVESEQGRGTTITVYLPARVH